MGDYSIYRGDSFVLDEQVRNDDGSIPNITNYTAWFAAKHNTVVADAQAVWFGRNGTGIEYTDPQNGRLRVTMPALATRDFPDGDVVLQIALKVRDPNGIVTTVEAGTLTVRPSAARAIV